MLVSFSKREKHPPTSMTCSSTEDAMQRVRFVFLNFYQLGVEYLLAQFVKGLLRRYDDPPLAIIVFTHNDDLYMARAKKE